MICKIARLHADDPVIAVKSQATKYCDFEIRLFTRELVAKAKEGAANSDVPATPSGVGGFAEWVILTLYALRTELVKSYHKMIDLVSEMSEIFEVISFTRLPYFSALRGWFEIISMETYRAFLGKSN